MKRHGGILSEYYKVKKANLEKLHTVCFQLYDTLERQNSGDSKRIAGCQDRMTGGMNRQNTKGFILIFFHK